VSPATCTQGHSCGTTGVSVPDPCPAKTYCPAGTVAPRPCPLAHYCPAASATPVVCPVGSVCGREVAVPEPCPKGYTCATTGTVPLLHAEDLITQTCGTQQLSATSCADVLASTGAATGIQWISGLGGAAHPVHCDAEWQLAVKWSRDVDGAVASTLNMPARSPHALLTAGEVSNVDDEEIVADVAVPNSDHYVSDFAAARWGQPAYPVQQVRLAWYESGTEAKSIVFNGEGSDAGSWFHSTRILSSPWTDLHAGLAVGVNDGVVAQGLTVDYGRVMFMHKYYGGCDNDYGWFNIVGQWSDLKPSTPGLDCGWENRYNTAPALLYAKGSTATFWGDASTVPGTLGHADTSAVWVKLDASASNSPLMACTLEQSAQSTDLEYEKLAVLPTLCPPGVVCPGTSEYPCPEGVVCPVGTFDEYDLPARACPAGHSCGSGTTDFGGTQPPKPCDPDEFCPAGTFKPVPMKEGCRAWQEMRGLSPRQGHGTACPQLQAPVNGTAVVTWLVASELEAEL
jgi:hypothetical protein